MRIMKSVTKARISGAALLPTTRTATTPYVTSNASLPVETTLSSSTAFPPLPLRHDLEPAILQPHLLYDREALAREVALQEPGLNDLQRVAYNSITHALATSIHTANDVTAFMAAHPDGPIPPNFFFVYSPGGCGKTHLNTLLLNRVRSQGHIALAMASSGIAAFLMDGGSTFHSRCKPPKQPYVDGRPAPCAIPFGKPIGELFMRAHLLLCDEVSMLNRCNIECLDVALRTLCPTSTLPLNTFLSAARSLFARETTA
jgi:hypothetical protein